MPSKMILLFVVSMFVGGCTILWNYWNHFKKPPKKKIFISADCWLCVFDLITPSQLGLGIAMISHRFEFYVDEHFKSRRWALKRMEIKYKFEADGTKEMEIVNLEIAYYDRKPLPIPQIQLPRKVIGFKGIEISFIDRNVITFLHRFRPIFATCPTNLIINIYNDRVAEFLLCNILPMLGKNIHVMGLTDTVFSRLRQLVPSILNDFPSLRVFTFYTFNLFTEFPADESAMASDGQAVAKWLFTPRPDNVPKVLRCYLSTDEGNWMSKSEAIKAAFANASSPVNFIVLIWIGLPFADSVVLFNLINELTREQLTLKRIDNEHFLLIRCPIVRNASKWAKWEEEASDWQFYNRWNQIFIQNIWENEMDDELLDANPGPSDQPQK